MIRFATFTILAAMLVSSCGTAITGEFPFPVLNIEGVSIDAPQQIVDGETHTLNFEWTGGADTFTVTWAFGGATLQTVMETSGPERESSVDVIFQLDGEEPGTFSGLVQVIDERDNQLDYSFSYEVQAQN